jgi:hypothetical protein
MRLNACASRVLQERHPYARLAGSPLASLPSRCITSSLPRAPHSTQRFGPLTACCARYLLALSVMRCAGFRPLGAEGFTACGAAIPPLAPPPRRTVHRWPRLHYSPPKTLSVFPLEKASLPVCRPAQENASEQPSARGVLGASSIENARPVDVSGGAGRKPDACALGTASGVVRARAMRSKSTKAWGSSSMAGSPGYLEQFSEIRKRFPAS